MWAFLFYEPVGHRDKKLFHILIDQYHGFSQFENAFHGCTIPMSNTVGCARFVKNIRTMQVQNNLRVT